MDFSHLYDQKFTHYLLLIFNTSQLTIMHPFTLLYTPVNYDINTGISSAIFDISKTAPKLSTFIKTKKSSDDIGYHIFALILGKQNFLLLN